MCPDMRAALEQALEALDECETYFADRQDADHYGERFVPNKEMLLLMTVAAAARIVEDALGEKVPANV
jgi:hypothetical protein